MKRMLLLLFIILFMAGCAEHPETATQQAAPKLPVINTYVVSTPAEEVEVKTAPVIKEITVRLVDNGFSPETIRVNKGDRVGLYITDTQSVDVSTFGISGYPVEDFVHTGNTIYIEFVADRQGSFEFGDERTTTRKGVLYVV